jgi:hypothetical protein
MWRQHVTRDDQLRRAAIRDEARGLIYRVYGLGQN